LWEGERPCPLQSALHEHLDFRRDQLGAIETAELHENDAREALQVVGVQPGTADGTEDAIEPFACTCLGIRIIVEALGASAEQREIRFRHREECRRLSAGRPLAIQAMAVCDEARVGIELELHGTAGTLTRVLLAHVISLSTSALKTISKNPTIW